MFSQFAFRKAMRMILIQTIIVSLLSFAPTTTQISFAQDGEQPEESEPVDASPVTGKALEVPQAQMSAKAASRLLEEQYRRRLEAAQPYNVDTSAEALLAPESWQAVDESSVSEYAEARFHGVPSNFVLGSNVLNTQADNTGNSTLAEPAAANEGPNIFYAGNFGHNEFSTNGGATWTNVTIPAGPSEAPSTCCDWDVVYDQARGVTFYSGLYLNATRTNGLVRIFVRRDMSMATNCFYDIDPAGTSNNTVPDYPHINISNDFLYLGTNNTGGAAGGRAQMYRFPLDQMADCVTAPGNVFTYVWSSGVGQRIFVPIEGARETMFWFIHEDSNTLRIYRWPESTTTVTSVLRDVGTSSFGVDEDCSGGSDNADWWDSLAASLLGFNNRGALGNGRLHLYWNVASDASHTQGHIHGAIIAINPAGAEHVVGSTLAQPVIFNNSFCYGFPNVSANERGDIGMTLAAGGNLGSSCTSLGCNAAQPVVGIDDDFTAGLGVFGASGANFNIYATGTHNRFDQRFGDYFVIHPHEPCDLWFGATGYALNGGRAASNVNARWIEFGRQRDKLCYDRWDDEDPVP